MRLPLLVTVVLLCGACSSGPSVRTIAVPDGELSSSPAPQGPVPAARLEARLLQPADLPTLTDRRAAASADLTTQATPQLQLCTPDRPVASHELANVIAKPTQVGQAQVFELLSVFGTPAGAREAFDRAVAATARCRSYRVGDRAYAVADLRRPAVPGATAALQFRLTTPDVVGGDVVSVALAGSSVVLVTGYGAPPAGQTLLGFQAGVLAKAVARAAQ